MIKIRVRVRASKSLQVTLSSSIQRQPFHNDTFTITDHLLLEPYVKHYARRTADLPLPLLLTLTLIGSGSGSSSGSGSDSGLVARLGVPCS